MAKTDDMNTFANHLVHNLCLERCQGTCHLPILSPLTWQNLFLLCKFKHFGKLVLNACQTMVKQCNDNIVLFLEPLSGNLRPGNER